MPQTSGPAPPRIVCNAAETEVIIRGRLRSGTGTVLAILAGAIGIGLLFAFFSPRPEAIPVAAPTLLIAAAAALACWVALQILGHERLRVNDNEVVYERHLATLCWHRQSIPRSGPIDLRKEARGSRRGVIVAAGGERCHAGRALEAEAIDWLHGWLAERLQRKDKVA